MMTLKDAYYFAGLLTLGLLAVVLAIALFTLPVSFVVGLCLHGSYVLGLAAALTVPFFFWLGTAILTWRFA